MQSIVAATQSYEDWMATQIPVVAKDIEFKHQQMRSSCFSFLRATYYRWMQVFPRTCEKLLDTPKVLAVGDLHVENFGTWRDAEGRLIWGVNDFDEATSLPFVLDLVRLATSLLIAIQANHLKIDFDAACECLIDGYLKSIDMGGRAFVLAERHSVLRRLATGDLRNPVPFWEKMSALPNLGGDQDQEGIEALRRALPEPTPIFELKSRRAGLGSLGRPRYVALAEWRGGLIAREVKALMPSATKWANHDYGVSEIEYTNIVSRAVRCPDPVLKIDGDWIVRRLAPDCSRIELSQLPDQADEEKLVMAMGRETANIHLGTAGAASEITRALSKLPKNWLVTASDAMSDAVHSDFNAFRKEET